MQTPARLNNGDTSAYGFGLVVSRYRGARVVDHNGADAGYRSYVGRFPEHGLAIAIACNAATANTTALAHGVADVFLGAALAPVVANAAPVEVKLSESELRRRAGVYVQPTSLQVLELVMRDGKLTVGRNTGAALVPVAPNRFRTPGQATELTFVDGDHAGVEQRSALGARAIMFERKQPVALRPSELTAYAGDYYSEELDARYRVTSSDSSISLRTGTSAPFVARPIYPDGFLGGGYTIQFFRSGTGITGFDVTDGRMRHVRFARTPDRPR
jgi:hypothetical protein